MSGSGNLLMRRWPHSLNPSAVPIPIYVHVSFSLRLADGSDYAGIAPVGHCRKADGSAVGRDEPAAGQQIPGMVDAILAGNGDNQVRVSLPNSEAIIVKRD